MCRLARFGHAPCEDHCKKAASTSNSPPNRAQKHTPGRPGTTRVHARAVGARWPGDAEGPLLQHRDIARAHRDTRHRGHGDHGGSASKSARTAHRQPQPSAVTGNSPTPTPRRYAGWQHLPRPAFAQKREEAAAPSLHCAECNRRVLLQLTEWHRAGACGTSTHPVPGNSPLSLSPSPRQRTGHHQACRWHTHWSAARYRS